VNVQHTSDQTGSYTIDWGDGDTETADYDTTSVVHTYLVTGFYTISATLGDQSPTASHDIEVLYGGDHLLTVALADGSSDIYEATAGTDFSITATYTDPAGHHVQEWYISWGDGTSQTVGSIGSAGALSDPTGPVSDATSTDHQTFTHTYSSDHPSAYYPINIDAITDENVYSHYFGLLVNNPVDPYASDNLGVSAYNAIESDSSWEGGILDGFPDAALSIGVFTAGSFIVNWGDGTPDSDPFNLSPGDNSNENPAPHDYRVAGIYFVTVTETPSDTTTYPDKLVGHALVEVFPSGPQITPPPSQFADLGQKLGITLPDVGVESDENPFPGMGDSLDPLFGVFAWEDGTAPQLVPATDESVDLSNVLVPTHLTSYGQTNGLGAGVSVYNGNASYPDYYQWNYDDGYPANWQGGDAGTSFQVYVWTVVLGDGSDNDLLIGSPDGTQNLQPVEFYFPHPDGEALDLTITTTDDTDNEVWDTPTPGPDDTPVLGDGATSYTLSEGPDVSSATLWASDVTGNTTADVFQVKLSASMDTENSTSDYLEKEEEQDADSVPAELPVKSNGGSDVTVHIQYQYWTPGSGANYVENPSPFGVNKVMVGDAISLKAVVIGPLLTLSLLNNLQYQWDVQGNVLYDWAPVSGTNSYKDAFAAGAPTPYSAPDMSTSSIPFEFENAPGVGRNQVAAKFFWVTTAGGATSELDDVTLTVNDVTDDLFSKSATTTFQVWEPTMSKNVVSQQNTEIDPATGNIHLGVIKPAVVIPGLGWLSSAIARPAVVIPGITFQVQLNVPAWNGIGSGKAELLQVIDAHGSQVTPTLKTTFMTQGVLAADGGFPSWVPAMLAPGAAGPLGGPWPVGALPTSVQSDSPADFPAVPTVTTISINDSFQTYVMYCDSPGLNHWVPVGIKTWGWGGTEINVGVPTAALWKVVGWLYPAVPAPPIVSTFVPYSGDEPKWSVVLPAPYPGSGYK
jgi:hypothetical protein